MVKYFYGSVVKNPSDKQEMQVRSLGQEDHLEKKMATHFSILAWKIPWTEEPGSLQSMGSQKKQTWLSTHTHTHTHTHTYTHTHTHAYTSVMYYSWLPHFLEDGGMIRKYAHDRHHVFSFIFVFLVFFPRDGRPLYFSIWQKLPWFIPFFYLTWHSLSPLLGWTSKSVAGKETHKGVPLKMHWDVF